MIFKQAIFTNNIRIIIFYIINIKIILFSQKKNFATCYQTLAKQKKKETSYPTCYMGKLMTENISIFIKKNPCNFFH